MRHMHRYGLAALALLLVLAGMSGPASTARGEESTPTPTPVITATVSPQAGAPGTTFTFAASGLRSRQHFFYWLSGPDGTTIGDSSSAVQADKEGNASWTWTAPASVAEGPWLMVFQNDPYSPPQTIRFAISGQAPPEDARAAPSYQPGGIVQPSAGRAGTSFNFSSDGFAAKEQVQYWFNVPNGTVIGAEDFRVEADDLGRVTYTWATPQDTPPGVWQIVLFGRRSSASRTITFEVLP